MGVAKVPVVGCVVVGCSLNRNWKIGGSLCGLSKQTTKKIRPSPPSICNAYSDEPFFTHHTNNPHNHSIPWYGISGQTSNGSRYSLFSRRMTVEEKRTTAAMELTGCQLFFLYTLSLHANNYYH